MRPTAARYGRSRTATRARVWRAAFLRGPRLRDALVRLGLVAETFVETAVTWDRFGQFHEGVLAAVRQGHGPGRAARAWSRAGSRTWIPTARRPTDSAYAPWPPRLRTRAVGRDQARGVGGDARARRDDHPSPRGRPRPPPLVPAGGSRRCSPTRCAARRRSWTRPGITHPRRLAAGHNPLPGQQDAEAGDRAFIAALLRLRRSARREKQERRSPGTAGPRRA